MMKKYSFDLIKNDEESFPFTVDGIYHPDMESVLLRDLDFCGCGDAESALEYIYKHLKKQKDCRENKISYKENDSTYSSPGEQYFFLYVMDNKEFMEHGTSVWSAWLTEKGKNFINDYEIYKEL